MKRKVVGTIKMRNGSIIKIVEGTEEQFEKLRGMPLPMKLVPTPNGEGYVVDEEAIKKMLEE